MNTALDYASQPDDPDSGPPAPARHKHRWLRIAGWSVFGVFTFVVLALLLLASLVNTDGEHRAIMNLAQSQATKALTVPVHLQNLVLHWYPLSVDLYGLKVDGARPASQSSAAPGQSY